MKKGLFITSAIVLLLVFLTKYSVSGDQKAEGVSQEQIRQNMHRIQIPFIANNGQMDERVTFYANTFGGTVFVTKEGEIVYALPKSANDNNRSQETGARIQRCRGELHSPDVIHDTGFETQDNQESCIPNHASGSKSAIQNSQSEIQGVALKETLIGAKVKEIKGEDKSATKINYFKGNDQKKWKSNISTYDVVDLGEVYNGIELKLKAYGNNVEKLFYVKPGANPDQIKINLSGIRESKSEVRRQKSEVGSQTSEVRNQKSDAIASSLNSEFRNPILRINEHGESSRLGEACPEPVEWACPEPVEWAKRTQQNNITKGTSGLWVNEQGQLVAETELGPVTFTKPVAYQEIDGKRVDVAVEYEIYAVPQVVHRKDAKNAKESIVGNTENAGNVCPPLAGVKGVERDSPHVIQPTTNPKSKIANLSSTEIGCPKLEYGFKVASYDKTKELVIDPLLASTFLGDYSVCYKIALDSDGNVYVSGKTSSAEFPTTEAAYDISKNGSYRTENTSTSNDPDIFVSKFDSDLQNLIASTYLGGTKADNFGSMEIDSKDNVYIVGYTESSDFPTTEGAYDTTSNGGFISKLNNDLTELLASTMFSVSPNSICIGTDEEVYITGHVQSNLSTTEGAYDTSFNGVTDAFLAKFNGDLTDLLASTFLGGSDSDRGYSVAIDSNRNVYIFGSTGSSDFPTTEGAYDTSHNGKEDCLFISKLNNNLTVLEASTFLDGYSVGGYESLIINNSGSIYVAGHTSSTDYPTTTGAYQTSSNGQTECYISKLSADLSSLQASTFLGGADDDVFHSISVDSNNNIYVTGWTESSDFPITSNAYDISLNDSCDVFISKFNSDLTSILASTYLGGSSCDESWSVVIDSSGNVYISGVTPSSDFPIISGSYDTSYSRNNAFISKIDNELSASSPTTTTNSAISITMNSATLNGTVNANNRSTIVWFEYGLYSDLYDYSTSTKTISGSSDQTISISPKTSVI